MNVPLSPARASELGLILLTGAVHVTLELMSGTPGSAARIQAPLVLGYQLAAISLWGIYALWRMSRSQRQARTWGFRVDNIGLALRRCLRVAAPAAVAMIAYGGLVGRLPVPKTFWLVLPLYLLYGLAQQFALQALLARNLRSVFPHRMARTLVVAMVFSAAHIPDVWLMLLTFVVGLALTWCYDAEPNLFVIGSTHGLLGALAYYLLLGEDPWAAMVETARRWIWLR